MGGIDLSLPTVAAFRPKGGGGGGGGPPTNSLAAAIAGGAVAAMTLTVSAEQAETAALVARMTVAPNATRRGLIDALIGGLKADGVWAKLDWLVLLAAHDAQAARLNWRATKALSAVNVPSFTVDRGYAFDGATSYLTAGEAFGTGGQYGLNSAFAGGWINQELSGDGQVTVIGADVTSAPLAYVNVLNSGSAPAYLNQADNPAMRAATDRLGFHAASRTGSTTLRAFLGASMVATGSGASTGVPVAAVVVGRITGFYNRDRRAALAWGGGLSDGEVAALHGRLNTFLTAIGAN